MDKKTHETKLIHCLHGNRVPVFDMATDAVNKVKEWLVPRIRFTMALVETDNEYRYGISVILNQKEQYCRKLGLTISKGRAMATPFLVVAKSSVTRDEAIELLYLTGYKITNTSKHRVKSWNGNKFDSEHGKDIFRDFFFESGRKTTFEAIDVRTKKSNGEGF